MWTIPFLSESPVDFRTQGPLSATDLGAGERSCTAVRETTLGSCGGVGLEALCRCAVLKKSHKVLLEGLSLTPCRCAPDPRSEHSLSEGGEGCFRSSCVVPRPITLFEF
jgi:hypothetical protein